MRTLPALTYAPVRENSPFVMQAVRTMALMVIVLSTSDIAMKLCTRDANLYFADDPSPRSARDALATLYFIRLADVIHNAKCCVIGAMAATTILCAARIARQKRISAEYVAITLAWATVIASYLVPAQLWCRLYEPM
jgi:hypothetical protein